MNAIQVSDVLMGGFASGLAAIQERNEERAQVQMEAIDGRQADVWKAYAGKLEKALDTQTAQIESLKKNYEASEEYIKGMSKSSREYTGLLVSRIKKLDNALKRESANTHATQMMRDRLLTKLNELADPTTCELLDEEKQLELHNADWQSFLEGNNPPCEIPLPGNKGSIAI